MKKLSDVFGILFFVTLAYLLATGQLFSWGGQDAPGPSPGPVSSPQLLENPAKVESALASFQEANAGQGEEILLSDFHLTNDEAFLTAVPEGGSNQAGFSYDGSSKEWKALTRSPLPNQTEALLPMAQLDAQGIGDFTNRS